MPTWPARTWWAEWPNSFMIRKKTYLIHYDNAPATKGMAVYVNTSTKNLIKAESTLLYVGILL